jgi:hypothetical protein
MLVTHARYGRARPGYARRLLLPSSVFRQNASKRIEFEGLERTDEELRQSLLRERRGQRQDL